MEEPRIVVLEGGAGELLEELLELDREVSWEVVDERYKSMGFEEYAARHREVFMGIYRSPGEQAFIVALDASGRPIGMAWIREEWDTVNYIKYAYLYDLEVRREHRRSGLGKRLLEEAIRYCERKGYAKLGLRVESRNAGALRMYEEFGFRPIALIMELQLGGGGASWRSRRPRRRPVSPGARRRPPRRRPRCGRPSTLRPIGPPCSP